MWLEEKLVSSVLLTLKPVGNYKGFWILVTIIEEILSQKKLDYNLSHDIYPAVAQLHNCSIVSIERNLRTLILNLDMTKLSQLAGINISSKITASQLIDILVTYFILNYSSANK